MTIRRAADADRASLATLAALDSATVPEQPVLVAESEGRMLAAVPFYGGRGIADPFEPTEDVVALLELRARQIREAREASRDGHGLLGRLSSRLAA